MEPSPRFKLMNSPGRIFDHSTIHGKVHTCLYRMPWNYILPFSALTFIIFVSALSIKSGLEQADLYRRDVSVNPSSFNPLDIDLDNITDLNGNDSLIITTNNVNTTPTPDFLLNTTKKEIKKLHNKKELLLLSASH